MHCIVLFYFLCVLVYVKQCDLAKNNSKLLLVYKKGQQFKKASSLVIAVQRHGV